MTDKKVWLVMWQTRSDYRVKRPKKYHETIFEEPRELEEDKSREALVLAQKKHSVTM